jgi:hypothetical protein
MKRTVWFGLVCALFAAPAMADLVSFVDSHPLAGVDGSPLTYGGTAAWSTDTTTAQLDPLASYSLLAGHATVSASQSGSPATLSHQLPRGIGVWDDPTEILPGFFVEGVEADEIDAHFAGQAEQIQIAFTSPYSINSIELRSLFNMNNLNQGTPTPPEWAAVDFYSNGTKYYTEYLEGQEALGTLNGVASVSYANPLVVDQLVFRIPLFSEILPLATWDPNVLASQPLDQPILWSDYAVAKLDVTPTVPVPGALMLAGFGAGLVATRLRRRRTV